MIVKAGRIWSTFPWIPAGTARTPRARRTRTSLANAAGVPNPVGSAVKNVYAAAVASGKGEDYVPMLSDFVAGQSKVSLG